MAKPDKPPDDPTLHLEEADLSSGTTVRQNVDEIPSDDTHLLQSTSGNSIIDSSTTLKQTVPVFTDDDTERLDGRIGYSDSKSSDTFKQNVPVFQDEANTPNSSHTVVSEGGFTGTLIGSVEEVSKAEELASKLATSSNEIPIIPGYEIVRELGRGGMAVVYEAIQARLQRRVALKMILNRGFVTNDDKMRFFNEAQVIARMQHANIVGIYEFGEYQGLGYLTLEYIPGGSLDRQIRGTTMPPRDAATLVEKLARAIQIAHEQGVIHRDLKPANVLMTQAGEPKITDFGLAKQETSNLTASGAILGTPSYMAPEQARGDATGPTTDVYALGAILYELLVGRPPFKGATGLDTIQQVIQQEPLPVRTLQEKVDRDLETICLKCLQKEPTKRYTSAHELAEELRRFIEGRPIRARAVGSLEKTWRWCRRNPVVSGLAASIALLLLLSSVVASSLAIWANREKQQAQANAEQAKDNLYLTQMLLVQSAWEQQDYSQARRLIDQTKSDDDRRHFEWYFQNRLLDESQKTLAGHTHEVTAVAYVHKGSLLASAGKDKTILLWDSKSGTILRKFTGHGHFVTALAFSPDGKWLASASLDKTAKVWDVATGEVHATCSGHEYSVTAVAFSPDGQQLASASLDKTIRLWETATGLALDILHGHSSGATAVAFGPDGKQLISAGSDKTVRLWSAETGKLQQTFSSDGHSTSAMACSRDGRYLATAGNDHVIHLRDTASGNVVRKMIGHAKPVHTLAFSKSGAWLVSGGADETVRMWDTASGALIRTYLGHQGPVLSVAVSPEDDQIASGGSGPNHMVRLWAVVPGQTVRIVDKPKQIWNTVRYSPQGDRLAVGGRDRTAQLWDATTLQVAHNLPGHEDEVTAVAFSRDGEVLATGSADKTIRLWNAKTAELLRVLSGHADTVTSLVFSPDGKQLYSGSWDTSIRSWDVHTGQSIGVQNGHSHYVTSLALSSDGTLLASASVDKTIRIWDPTTGASLAVLTGHTDPVTAIAFSSKGKFLASTSADKTVRLWDAASGALVHVFIGHTDTPKSVEFSRDGQRLFSTGEDRTVRLWDLRTRQPMRTLVTTEFPCQAISLGQEDQRLSIATSGSIISLDGRPMTDATTRK